MSISSTWQINSSPCPSKSDFLALIQSVQTKQMEKSLVWISDFLSLRGREGGSSYSSAYFSIITSLIFISYKPSLFTVPKWHYFTLLILANAEVQMGGTFPRLPAGSNFNPTFSSGSLKFGFGIICLLGFHICRDFFLDN